MSASVESLLAGQGKTGVYRLASRHHPQTVAELAEMAGWEFLYLDLEGVGDKRAFLRAAAEALHFPKWAGRNWDAFEELVNDLSWLPEAKGYLLLVEHAQPLATAEPESWRTALDILESAATQRGRAGSLPLVVLVRAAGRTTAGYPALRIAQSGGQ